MAGCRGVNSAQVASKGQARVTRQNAETTAGDETAKQQGICRETNYEPKTEHMDTVGLIQVWFNLDTFVLKGIQQVKIDDLWV